MYKLLFWALISWTCITLSPAKAQGYTPDLIELDGKNGLTVIPHPNFAIADQGMIEFWVIPDWTNDPGYDPVVISNAGAEGVSYLIALLRDRDGLGLVAGERSEIVDFDFTDGKLHHLAINDYGDSVVVIIDGQIKGRFDGFSFENFSSNGVWIGSADGETAPFVGAIAGLRIWGTPVDQQSILAYSGENLLTREKSPHPDIDALRAVSDFRNRDLLIVDPEGPEQ